MAHLDGATVSKLDKLLPANWSHSNPIDIIGDADPARFEVAIEAALEDPNVDGVVVNFTPQMRTDPIRTAEAFGAAARQVEQAAAAGVMGEGKVAAARKVFQQAKMANYRTRSTPSRCSTHWPVMSTISNCCCRCRALAHNDDPRVDQAAC